MNDLLNSIDLIQESSDIAEIEVISSLIESYTKASIMLEQCDDITEFGFIQEDALGQFLNDTHDPVKGRPNESKLKRILMFIPRLIEKLLRLIVSCVGGMIAGLMAGLVAYKVSRIVDGQIIYSPVDLSKLVEIVASANAYFNITRDVLEETRRESGKVQCEKMVDADISTDQYAEVIGGFIGKPEAMREVAPPVTFDSLTSRLMQCMRDFDKEGSKHSELYKNFEIRNKKELIKYITDFKSVYSEMSRVSKEAINLLRQGEEAIRNNPESTWSEVHATKIGSFRANITYMMEFFVRVSKDLKEYMMNHYGKNVRGANKIGDGNYDYDSPIDETPEEES